MFEWTATYVLLNSLYVYMRDPNGICFVEWPLRTEKEVRRQKEKSKYHLKYTFWERYDAGLNLWPYRFTDSTDNNKESQKKREQRGK